MKRSVSMKKQFFAWAVAALALNVQSAEFAEWVVSYDPGVGFVQGFTNAAASLGEPSRVNPFGEPTDPFDPPYGKDQIVSIGAGGSLTVFFPRGIRNHPQNQFDLDFTIFGNCGFVITNDFDFNTFNWIGTPATDGSIFAENTGLTRVSVSRDGFHFFAVSASTGGSVDNLFPTDGAGDFGIPVAPSVTQDDFAGLTLDGIQAVYNGSAGGTSFDLATAVDDAGRRVHVHELHFVRVEVLSGKAEIDGFATVNRKHSRKWND